MIYVRALGNMLDLNTALVIVGILFLIIAWIMHSGDVEYVKWFPWLFGGVGIAFLLTAAGKITRKGGFSAPF